MHTVTLCLIAALATGCTRDVAHEEWVERHSHQRYLADEVPMRDEPLVTTQEQDDRPRVKTTVLVKLRSGADVKHTEARVTRANGTLIVDRGPWWPPLRTYAVEDVRLVQVESTRRERATPKGSSEPSSTVFIIGGVVVVMVLLAVALGPAIEE